MDGVASDIEEPFVNLEKLQRTETEISHITTHTVPIIMDNPAEIVTNT